MKRVKCPVCGAENWPGREYCLKCSWNLFEKDKEAAVKKEKAV